MHSSGLYASTMQGDSEYARVRRSSFFNRNTSSLVSTMTLRLPESLHRRAKELARQEGISINQLVATALAEKISALAAGEYLQKRAARGDRRKYERALRKVKSIEPAKEDRIA